MKYIIPFLIFLFGLTSCNLSKNKKNVYTIITEYKDEKSLTSKNELPTIESKTFPTDNAEYLVGQGYNSSTTEVMGNVVKYDPNVDSLITMNNAKGQTTFFEMKRITTFDELSKFMGLELSSSLNIGVFKASGRVKMLENYSFNSFSDFLAVKVRVENPAKILKIERLTEEALSRANEGQDEFMKYAGDEFINGIITGGEAIAIYEFTSKSEQERKQLRIQLDASVKAFFISAKVSSDFQEQMNKLSAYKSKSISFYRRGDTSEIAHNPDTLITYMANFPKIIADNNRASVLFYLTKPTKYVAGLPMENRNFSAIDEQGKVIRASGRIILKLYKVKGDIKYVSENPDEFEKDISTTITDKGNKIDELIHKIDECIKSCAKDFTICKSCQSISFDEKEYVFKRKSFNDADIITQPQNIKVFTWNNLPERYNTGRAEITTFNAGQIVDFYCTGIPSSVNTGNGRLEPQGNCLLQENSGDVIIEFRALDDETILLQRETFYKEKNFRFTSRQKAKVYLLTKTTKGLSLYNCDGINQAIRVRYW